MSAVAHSSAPARPRNGGVAARRALIRWAWRLFRREWRQQLLVVALLAVAVAAAIAGVSVVDNLGAAEESELGTGNALLTFDGSDPRKLAAGLAAARNTFGTTDVVGHREVTVPGSVETVDYRAQDPDGAYAGALLSLREGAYPIAPAEIAVTDGVARLLRLELGSSVTLDARRRTVVGIVENPTELSDEFALVAPSSAGAPEFVSVFVDASDESIDSFFGTGRNRPPAFAGMRTRGDDHPEAEPLAMTAVTTVLLLLASLIATASFAVVAQRRLRQLGMLAAVGATEKQLRLPLLANGAIVGAIAAVVGTAAGLAAWVAFAPTLESAVGHRIDRFGLPWWLIATTVLLAVLGATAAAWWPGRAASRLPVVLALSGRPPRPRPAHHSAIAALALIAAGVGCLALSGRERTVLIVAGIVATILGGLLLGPLAIRIFSGLAGRVSIAPRLALRDLVRYQARSGAALAAVTLALAIAATVVVVASAEAAEQAGEPPTLSERQIRVYLGPAEERGLTPLDAPRRLSRLDASVRQLGAELDRATVIPLRKATQPGAPPLLFGDTRLFAPLDFMRRSHMRVEKEGELYVATPAMLRYLGIDPATIRPGTDFLVDRGARMEGLSLYPDVTTEAGVAVTHVQRIEIGQHLFGIDSAQTPPAFVTLDGLRRHGWNQIPAGWLVESAKPLTDDQIGAARQIAADGGITMEVQEQAPSNARMMAIATGAGAVLALAILALTLGLIRSESAGDLRTLTATGATSRIRRTLTATTAGALALLGAVLGVAGAYVVELALFYDDLGYLSDVPVLWLVLALLGVPLAATAAGWIMAGREPPAIARTVLE